MNFKTIAGSILRFFFRRVDFLNKSIYVLVAAIIRELGALGFGDAVVEIAKEVKQNVATEGLKYWGVRALEILLAGGNWITVGVLLIMLIGISILKFKTRHSPAIKHHFNSQLRSIEELIDSFQVTTAQKFLIKIKQDIQDSYLRKSDRDDLSAWAYHLLGLCRIDNGKTDSPMANHIKSYQLRPDVIEYQERACTSYFLTDQKEKALQLAVGIIHRDGLNQRAWAVRLCSHPSNELASVPASVRAGITFKRLYANHLLSKDEESKAQAVLSGDLEKRTAPMAIDFANIDYWDLVGRFAFHLGIQQQPNNFASAKDDYKNNTLIQYSNIILRMVFDRIADTELYKNTPAAKLAAFYYFQTEYLLKGDQSSVNEMLALYTNHLASEDSSNTFADAIVICLAQLHRYEDVMTVTGKLDRDDHFVHLMEFQALQGLGRNEEAHQAFTAYFAKLDSISEIDVNNLLAFADFLIRQKKDVAEFYQSYIEPKRFESDLNKAIVFCYCHRFLPEYAETIKKILPQIIEAYPGLRYELRNITLIVLLLTKNFQDAASLIEQFHDWKNEQPPLFLYTECLLALRNDSSKLLEVLKYRRDHFPEAHLFIEEISIYELVENSEEILAIAAKAKSKYPGNPNFEFYFIYALYKLGRDEELKMVLNESLFEINFNWRQKFVLAKVCIEKNQKLLGLELFYRETVNNGANSSVIRQSYFILTTKISDRGDMPWPETVTEDTVVKIRAGEEESFITIDENSKKTNWIAKHLLGLRNGSSIRIEDPVTQKKIELTVTGIFDKYSGLSARIADEIGKSNLTGMDIRSVRFDTTSPESISKALIEAFGEAGDKAKIRRDEAFRNYYCGKVSFTELVRSVSRDQVFEVYSYLTSRESEGFLVIPIRDFNNVQLSDTAEFVIDFTTLPMLMKLSESDPGMYKRKFIISQFAIELVKGELEEARAMQEEGMFVSITSSGVRPTLHPPGYKEHRIATFQKMLDWISAHCETRISKDKLDMILQRPDLVKQTDLYYNYFIDTAFISHGRTLVSDDRIHNRSFNSHYLTVSVEYFLQHFYAESFKKAMLPALVQNHYIGITLDAQILMQEFKKPFYGGKNTFHYCLENLPFSVHHDATVFNEALDFVKGIYTEQMPLNFKKETSQKVLVNVLKDYPHLLHLKKNLVNEINTRFFLLQNYLPEVLHDFTVALEILNRSS